MPSPLLETGVGRVTESVRDFRILHDERMTITLVCRTRLYVTGTGRNRRAFASVLPERIVVESPAGRQEIQVPSAAGEGLADGAEAGSGA